LSHPHSIIRVLSVLATALPVFAASPDFQEVIQPILETNCVRCHTASKVKGGLRMDTHEKLLEGGDTADAVVPGDSAKSELLVRIHLRPIDEGVMPDEGQALQAEEVALLDAWVAAGAKWPEGITLTERKPEKPKRVAMPAKAPASNADAAAMLDDLLRRENADTGVITTDPINANAFLRRSTIDLIGRIPTVVEIQEYESWGDDRRKKLVSKLTTHPRFADRWTIFMADMLRIRSNVTGGNQLLAYVHGSLQQEKPYDVLVRELISASGRANSNPAVGYILGDDAQPMELAAATSQIFLGVQIGCAMCHDHPFDDWEQEDFYDLAAFFGKTKKVQSQRQGGTVYTTEGNEMTVLWPPEDKAPPPPTGSRSNHASLSSWSTSNLPLSTSSALNQPASPANTTAPGRMTPPLSTPSSTPSNQTSAAPATPSCRKPKRKAGISTSMATSTAPASCATNWPNSSPIPATTTSPAPS